MGPDEMGATQPVVYIDGQPVQYGGEIALPEFTADPAADPVPTDMPGCSITIDIDKAIAMGRAVKVLTEAWNIFTVWLKEITDTLGKVRAAIVAAEEFRKALRWAEAYNRPLANRYHHTKKKRIRKKYAKRILAWYREEILG